MSEIRSIVDELIAAGLDAAHAAEIVIRAALAAKPADEAGERRRARDREYQAEKRRQSRAISAESDEPPPQKTFQPNLPKSSLDQNPTPLKVPPPSEIDEAFEAYNLVADEIGLPRAKLLTEGRRESLRARLAEHGLDGWREAMEGLRAPFCLGKNDRGWKASFDFCLQARSLAKLREDAFAGEATGPPMTAGMVAAASDEIAFRIATGQIPRDGHSDGNTLGNQGVVGALPAPHARYG